MVTQKRAYKGDKRGQMSEYRNYAIAMVLSVAVLFAWQYFYQQPLIEQERARQEAIQQQQQIQAEQQTQTGIPAPQTPDGVQTPTVAPGAATAPTGVQIPPATPGVALREATIAATERITIDTAELSGSINLTGARLDDLRLKEFRETVDPDSPIITLLSPTGASNPYFIETGWVVAQGTELTMPGRETVWQAEGASTLTETQPVTLVWESPEGLVFRRTISVDDHYLFTVEQQVTNRTGEAVTLFPYGLISRHGTPETTPFFILHEGFIGVFGDEGLQEWDYGDVVDDGPATFEATGGWLGITDKYWATTLIPDQNIDMKARYTSGTSGITPTYQADYLLDPVAIPNEGTGVNVARIFAGAKRVSIVDGYEAEYGIDRFELLIDWGWFYFITKPLFYALDFFNNLFGNFGVAILAVTVLIKLIFFPLANKSYVSMSRMKKVQPEMMKIRDRFKDDKMKQQQAMMELYKKEKINPLSGCLPILIQIPVFFALYKVLFVTIEMRHAPFFGWVQDLSAPDPTSIFNLFGLLPYDVPGFLLIGIWPIIMGVTMFIQMKLNPTPPDPTQAMIFNWMPVIFTFLLATFPAGLVIYWAWNNFLSILQQWVIMHRQGVKVELWDNIKSMFVKPDKDKKKESESPAE